MRRWKELFMMMALILIFFTVACVSQEESTLKGQTPESTLNSYIKSVNDRDRNEIVTMLSKSLQYKIGQKTSFNRNPVQNALYGLDREDAKIGNVKFLDVTQSEKSAQLEVDFLWYYPSGKSPFEDYQIVNLVNENGTWKLQDFFPFDDY